ncbi:hypothetical protein [Cyanobium sp. ATX 6F1]|uniref:hypothetical protein n=1 Tax=Cyanobium sp. ATX 6F1 TaxID=2823702 RepID=UPI0020CCED70|nr:hypothetical protein [Cyanobium sp. ATX 6F1]MCP9915812.1 hypothetical protein [Cyanobium sp. ATX 6F1]
MSTPDHVIVGSSIDWPEEERRQLEALCQQPSHGTVFGLWSDRPGDALTLEDQLRQEWADR